VLPNPCETPPGPLPPPGSPERWRGFREPLPLTQLWSPSGTKRVGLQVGHWQVEQVPAELRGLGHGAVGGGKAEWEVNLEIAQRAKALLEARGVEVDLLPATVPARYRAHAFVSIHADGDASGRTSGFKIARPGFSSVPEADDRLVSALYAAYGRETSLPRDDEHITLRMLYYYAFNSRRYCHAVAPGVPQAIVETGFLTSAADRALLLGNPAAAARGIADGVLAFLDHGRNG
jgi:N-acetylmuramoyl-L-alanine amidase